MTKSEAYWFRGDPYCKRCVENDDEPALSASEKQETVIKPGEGHCVSCGVPFEPESQTP